jgi:hypothetical protein
VPSRVHAGRGENRIEFRRKSPGETWDVTCLGLFAPGVAFGYLDTLAGGDQEHGSGFELHLPGVESGYLLWVTGYDADDGAEIAFELGDTLLVDLPAGENDGWGEGYQLLLGAERLVSGDNRLFIFNRRGAAETWACGWTDSTPSAPSSVSSTGSRRKSATAIK